MKNQSRKNKGFTLIELLIVVAIIGILAAVLIPNLLGARREAYNTAAMNCGRSIQTAQTAYVGKNRTYATSYADLDAAVPGMLDACVDEVNGTNQITVTPGTSDADGFSWEVEHAQGNTTYTATQSSVTAN